MNNDIRLPKYMKGDVVKTLDTGEGWKFIEKVIPTRINEEITLFSYELRDGIIVQEESIIDKMDALPD